MSFNPDEFLEVDLVPILDEHSFLDDDGKRVTVDEKMLEEIAENCNKRIADTNDYCPLVDGHTRDDAPEEEQPEILGWASNFVVKPLYNTGRKAIHATFHLMRDCLDKIKKRPRRSVEFWVGRKEIDPIALLGATTPQRDLGILRLSRQKLKDGKIRRYSRAAGDASDPFENIGDQEMPILNDQMSPAQAAAQGGQSSGGVDSDLANQIAAAIFQSAGFKQIQSSIEQLQSQITALQSPTGVDPSLAAAGGMPGAGAPPGAPSPDGMIGGGGGQPGEDLSDEELDDLLGPAHGEHGEEDEDHEEPPPGGEDHEGDHDDEEEEDDDDDDDDKEEPVKMSGVASPVGGFSAPSATNVFMPSGGKKEKEKMSRSETADIRRQLSRVLAQNAENQLILKTQGEYIRRLERDKREAEIRHWASEMKSIHHVDLGTQDEEEALIQELTDTEDPQKLQRRQDEVLRRYGKKVPGGHIASDSEFVRRMSRQTDRKPDPTAEMSRLELNRLASEAARRGVTLDQIISERTGGNNTVQVR